MNERWRQQWQDYQQRIDALSLRERGLVFAVALGLLLMSLALLGLLLMTCQKTWIRISSKVASWINVCKSGRIFAICRPNPRTSGR